MVVILINRMGPFPSSYFIMIMLMMWGNFVSSRFNTLQLWKTRKIRYFSFCKNVHKSVWRSLSWSPKKYKRQSSWRSLAYFGSGWKSTHRRCSRGQSFLFVSETNTSENFELLLLTTAVSQTGECLNSAIVVGSLSLEIAEKALNTSSEIQSNTFTCRTLWTLWFMFWLWWWCMLLIKDGVGK